MRAENIFSTGTSFREAGHQYAVVDQGPRSRVIRDQATKEVSTRTVAQLRSGYMAGKIIFDDLFGQQSSQANPEDTELERSLADYGEIALREVKIKRFYLDGLCPDGRMRFPKAELAGRIEALYREMPDKLNGVPRPDHPPAVSTVYEWRRQWRSAAFSNKRLVNRYDLRGRRPRPIPEELLPILEKTVDEFFLTQSRPSVSATLELAQAEVNSRNAIRAPINRLPRPTRRQIMRVLASGDRYELLRRRYGVAVATKATRIYRKKEAVEHLLERVEMDHTPLDLICVADENGILLGRPHLTVLIDVRSRMVLAAWISFRAPNADVVLRALKQAILPKDDLLKRYGVKAPWPARGVMRELVLDNGKDFHSSALEAAALDLGIQLVYCPPRQPRFKGTIERFLKEINYAFIHLLPGTTFAKYHLREEYDSLKEAVIPLEVLRRFVYRWIVEVYQKQFHRGLMGCALEEWQQRDGTTDHPVLPRRMDVLDVYLSASEERQLSSKGIEINSLFYSSPELEQLRLRTGNQPLTVRRNVDDVGYIHVLHPNTKIYFKALSTSFDYANGLTQEQHQFCRQRAREAYAALPHYNAMLAAKKELIDEARAMKEAHAVRLAQLEALEKKIRAAGAKAKKPIKRQKPGGRNGVELQCRAEMANIVHPLEPTPEPVVISFDDLELFGTGQPTLF